ncbi:MAG: hypothetical protein KGQ51_03160, partial [Planctomycetes bacterium]|nr:hypothetical protein [Planctomycetota bacterium]
MKKLVQNAARLLRRAISNELKRLRRKALEADIAASFRRLEPRRVLTVNGTFAAGVLAVDITADGLGTNTASLLDDPADPSGNQFFLDENGDGSFDSTNEAGGFKNLLTEIIVNGSGSNGGPRRFEWIDPQPAASLALFNLNSIQFNSVQEAFFQTGATVAQNTSLSVENTLEFGNTNRLQFQQNVDFNAGSIVMQNDSEIQAVGTIDIQGTAGDVVIAFLQAGGNITVNTTGNILDGDGAIDDPDISSAGDVSLTTTAGNIGSNVSDIFLADVFPNKPNPLEVVSIGNFTATAAGMIAIDVGDASTITANTNTLWIQSVGDLDASTLPPALLVGKTNLALIADVDGDSVGNLTVTDPITATGDLRLSGFDVISSGPTIVAQAQRLMFYSENSEILETTVDDLDARSLADLTVIETGDLRLVDLNNDTIALSANGSLVVHLPNGNLMVDSVVQNDGSNLLLQADGPTGNITLNALVSAADGPMTLLAQQNINQNADVSITNVSANGITVNTIYALAVTGSITMGANASSTTQGGNIYYRAANNVTVGVLNAGNGGIWIEAAGNIVDAQNDTVGVDTDGFAQETNPGTRVVNLIGNTAVLRTLGDIGVATNPLDTSIETLATEVNLNTYIYESDELTIGDILASSVEGVNIDSSVTPIATSGLSGASGVQHVKVETIDGDLTINNPVNAGLNILLVAGGATRNLTIDAPVNSSDGAITLLARGSINQNEDVNVTSGANVTANTIYATAMTGSITMSTNATSSTQGGNIYYRAANNVTVGVLNAGDGGIWVEAAGNIFDAQNDTVGVDTDGFAQETNPGTRVVNLIASTAVLRTLGDIGVATNPLDTSIETLATEVGLNTYIYETDALVIGNVSGSSVTRVNLDSTVTAVGTPTLAGSEGGEHVKVETIDGNLAINNPVNAGLNILLVAGGATRNLTIDAPVNSSDGAITLLARGSIN